jgi:hypothetical protein
MQVKRNAGGPSASGRVPGDLGDQLRPQRRRGQVSHAVNLDEAAVGNRLGQGPARGGGPDDRILVSADHQDRLGDAGDPARGQFRTVARGELAGPAVPVPGVTPQRFRRCPAARHLVSVIEGLRWPVLFGVYTQEQAMGILDARFDLIFRPARTR